MSFINVEVPLGSSQMDPTAPNDAGPSTLSDPFVLNPTNTPQSPTSSPGSGSSQVSPRVKSNGATYPSPPSTPANQTGIRAHPYTPSPRIKLPSRRHRKVPLLPSAPPAPTKVHRLVPYHLLDRPERALPFPAHPSPPPSPTPKRRTIFSTIMDRIPSVFTSTHQVEEIMSYSARRLKRERDMDDAASDEDEGMLQYGKGRRVRLRRDD